MSDLVVCGECGTRYDSDQNAFCPRCGSTAQGKVLPAALQVARRNDPGRRRVQASGALLLVVGGLFLVSSLVGLAAPVSEVSQQFVGPMADQSGGKLRLVPPANTTFDYNITTQDGEPLANGTEQKEPVLISLSDHASVKVRLDWTRGTPGNWTLVFVSNSTFDAVVLPGDTLTIPVDGRTQSWDVAISPTLRTTVQVGRFVFIVIALVLTGGGLCAILLRAWGLAATASILGCLLAAVVLLGFLQYGLLFAVPFGFAAYFILRGKRHFVRKGE